MRPVSTLFITHLSDKPLQASRRPNSFQWPHISAGYLEQKRRLTPPARGLGDGQGKAGQALAPASPVTSLVTSNGAR